jgi:hypothetical protein
VDDGQIRDGVAVARRPAAEIDVPPGMLSPGPAQRALDRLHHLLRHGRFRGLPTRDDLGPLPRRLSGSDLAGQIEPGMLALTPFPTRTKDVLRKKTRRRGRRDAEVPNTRASWFPLRLRVSARGLILIVTSTYDPPLRPSATSAVKSFSRGTRISRLEDLDSCPRTHPSTLRTCRPSRLRLCRPTLHTHSLRLRRFFPCPNREPCL